MNNTMRLVTGAALAAVLFAGCASDGGFSARDLGTIATIGAEAAGKSPEEAQQYGNAATALAGAAAPITPEVEQRLGEGIAVKAYATEGKRHEDEALQRYVNLVGRAVSRQSARPDLLYSFAVIDNESPNAFAGPGGYIFVTTGALEKMENEAELAGVLAHEIAHVTERHMLTIYRKQSRFDAIFATAEAVSSDASRYGDAVNFGTDTLFNKGLGSQFEFDADKVGMEYAALAGYDPKGIVTFLERISKGEAAQPGGWLKTSTHPATSQRIAKCRQYLTTSLSGVDGKNLADRFAKNTASLKAGK